MSTKTTECNSFLIPTPPLLMTLGFDRKDHWSFIQRDRGTVHKISGREQPLAPCLLTLALFAGCQYFPKTDYFTTPETEPNSTWIRIVNFTQHGDLYQYENGIRSCGVIRSGPLPFIHSRDEGMPRAGQNLTSYYYETRIRPGIETNVGSLNKWINDLPTK
ncbi:hypothetical protein [Pseudomonas yamanorum]|uniref:hypothetical protein n=1 Tax=Pseudomonas yamanorum TaxID=515393 RepID=UPI00210BBFDA|nr:hypothetical protein [Pseudomonas yamanorum]